MLCFHFLIILTCCFQLQMQQTICIQVLLAIFFNLILLRSGVPTIVVSSVQLLYWFLFFLCWMLKLGMGDKYSEQVIPFINTLLSADKINNNVCAAKGLPEVLLASQFLRSEDTGMVLFNKTMVCPGSGWERVNFCSLYHLTILYSLTQFEGRRISSKEKVFLLVEKTCWEELSGIVYCCVSFHVNSFFSCTLLLLGCHYCSFYLIAVCSKLFLPHFVIFAFCASNSPPLHPPAAGRGKGKSERGVWFGEPWQGHWTEEYHSQTMAQCHFSLKRNNTFHGNIALHYF